MVAQGAGEDPGWSGGKIFPGDLVATICVVDGCDAVETAQIDNLSTFTSDPLNLWSNAVIADKVVNF